MEGAGGTLDDFAALVAEHIQRTQALPDADGFPTGETSPLFLWGLIRLLVECNDRDGPLKRALINNGITESIARLLCIYPGVPVKGKDKPPISLPF